MREAETTDLSRENRREWSLWLVLILILGAYYAALQNGLWIPSNDGELYLSIARNLSTSRGYETNGMPVVLVPPGWPLVLAAAVQISGSFWFLNLLSMSFLLATAGVFYWILRRLTSPRLSFLIVLIVGILFECYRLTFIQFSDALYCLFFSLAVLLAFQINENRKLWWRMPLLLLVCAATVTVRWSGALGWVVIAGALLGGQRRPGLNRQWLCAVLAAVVTLATFLGFRHELKKQAVRSLRAKSEASMLGQKMWSNGQLIDSNAKNLQRTIDVLGQTEYRILGKRWWLKYPKNLLHSGEWFTSLFWPPGQLSGSSKWFGLVANVIGWGLILLLLIGTGGALRKHQWVWAGILIHTVVLCAVWHSVPRYFVPVAPLLLLGIWSGFQTVRSFMRSAVWRRTATAGLAAFVSLTVLCNLSLYGVSVWTNRSENFYATYRASQCKELVSAAYYMSRHALADGSVAVNGAYSNLNRKRRNTFGCRALNMLLDVKVLAVPGKICSVEPNKQLVDWAQKKNVRFYLYRPPVSPWRLWHFRVPWLQAKMTGKPVSQNPYWVLYELQDDKFVKIDPPEVSDWPKRLPGL